MAKPRFEYILKVADTDCYETRCPHCGGLLFAAMRDGNGLYWHSPEVVAFMGVDTLPHTYFGKEGHWDYEASIEFYVCACGAESAIVRLGIPDVFEPDFSRIFMSQYVASGFEECVNKQLYHCESVENTWAMYCMRNARNITSTPHREYGNVYVFMLGPVSTADGKGAFWDFGELAEALLQREGPYCYRLAHMKQAFFMEDRDTLEALAVLFHE